MKRENFRPSPLGDARIDKPSTLVFARELRAPPERVWAALTDPAKITQWAPFDANRGLATTGSATLVMAGGTGDSSETSAIVVKRADRPSLLEYTWGNDLLRWELEPIATGTRLTLRHTVEDAGWLSRITAGWHMCLDVMDHALNGDAFGRIVGAEAKQFGWGDLAKSYAAMLGVPAPNDA